MRQAFTLIELVVAMAILAMVLSFAGVIFRVSTDSQRMARANVEIMQKLRVITEQLDADFSGLCKDGEILIFWRAAREPKTPVWKWNDPSVFERYDTIMFFATGDFGTYNANAGGEPTRGNLARICYTLANVPSANPSNPNPLRPISQEASKRMLVRTQHILMPPTAIADPCDPLGMSGWTDADGRRWKDWNGSALPRGTPAVLPSRAETDALSTQGWLFINPGVKADIMSVIGDVEIEAGMIGPGVSSTKYQTAGGGVLVDSTQPATMYTVLSEGVGQFEVQGWTRVNRTDPNDRRCRWAPEVDPNGNGDLVDDCDFDLILDPNKPQEFHSPSTALLRYPDGPLKWRTDKIKGSLRDRPFNDVPGLGRALKFTFTLYDSRGLIPKGRTFTHIVYLDN
jgi:prepilin-type N-terminal cleavage/methylation domain-containing protein